MIRYKAIIAYDGSRFEGFQKQAHTQNTVAGSIESALFSLGIKTTVVGSGRTDKGVHATAQVIHFDAPPFWDTAQKLFLMLNSKLHFIHIKKLYQTDQTFHARYRARIREYRYIFTTIPPSPFEQAYLSYYPDVDAKKLLDALSLFEGMHDFKFFHKTGSMPKSTVRTLYRAAYYTRNHLHIIRFCANGFLRSQVRMMVQAVLEVAQNRAAMSDISAQLAGKKRTFTRPAPPNGLYLSRVRY